MLKDNQYKSINITPDALKERLKKEFNMDIPSLEEIKNNKDIRARIILALEGDPDEITYEDDGCLYFYWNIHNRKNS